MERGSESKRNITLLTVLTVLSAAGLRLVGLGSASLTMNEAENAMTALHLFENGSRGQLLYERIDVAAGIHVVGIHDLLGRHVGRRASVRLLDGPIRITRQPGGEIGRAHV